MLPLDRGARSLRGHHFTMKQINIDDEQKVSYCIPLTLRDEQIKINIKKVKDRLIPVDYKIDEPIALVSFGPSLNDTWQDLRNYKNIMTCSGAHKFLLDKGLKASDFENWYHADLDPRLHKIKILGEPQKDIKYLIASTIHPNYLDVLKDCDVRLWHIFATDEEAERVLPKGEWKYTGGSSVGLRTFTLARALGYTDLHVYGMDGSMRQGQTHTTEHPNAPPQSTETEYKGKKYLTTNSMLHVAKETFKEMDQMHDCKFTFYGEGIIQDMFKDYVPKKKKATNLAFNSPETISKEYVELNKKLHETNPGYGMGGAKHAETVLKIIQSSPEIKTVGDYGSGKGMLAKELFKHGVVILEYDPAIEGKTELLPPLDFVVCSDVLEHIEEDKINIVLSDLKRVVKKIGYFVISTRKAVKTYANGKNAHLIIQGRDWWNKKLSKFFNIANITEKEKECELHVVVSPRTEVRLDITTVEKGRDKFKFYTPNDTTKWRANTLFTKEPSTIEWLDSIKEGEVLFDIGANVGSYSVYAGVRGVKVYSFEPEADNYALLVKNLSLNGIKENAYCLALSDKTEFGMLNLSQREIGGSCHNFGIDGGKIQQGCMAICMSQLFELGLPVPDHVKIDVDGNEWRVIKGIGSYLQDVKSIIVEIDPDSDEHAELKGYLLTQGFGFDVEQVEKATRKEGNFKGYAEYVFRKRELKDANFITTNYSLPYPYQITKGVFDVADYQALVKATEDLTYKSLEEARGTKGYPERYVAQLGTELTNLIGKEIERIAINLRDDFKLSDEYIVDAFLLKDLPGYKIGVHRDRLDKVVSALIYLPKDSSNKHAGTSIYKPKKEGFTCPIGQHYGFDEFEKVMTVPYEPNTMFAFLNTDHSFHGVEPCDVERNILLINLNKKK